MSGPARWAPAPWHMPGARIRLAAPTRGVRRLFKLFAVVAGVGLQGANGYWVLTTAPVGESAAVAGYFLAGLGAADFVSGLVHWAADIYGSSSTPVFGGFVGTFRLHHRDQADITRHDVIEANADVFTFSAPPHLAVLALVHDPLWLSFAFGLFLASYPSSQLHKWAHLQRRPVFIHWLQRLGVLLSPERHARHHAGHHDRGYCITTGWLNPVLDRVRFFRGLEWLLAKLGVRPTYD